MTDTPDENPTARMGRRVVAHLIDLVVSLAAIVVPFVLLGTKVEGTVSDSGFVVDVFRDRPDYAVRIQDQQWLFERNDLIIGAGVAVGVTLLFTVVIQGRFGWTIGKALTGIRTVNKEGDRPGIFRAFFRTLLWVIDGLPTVLPILPLVGGLVALSSKTNRRVGDLVAGTYVIEKRYVGEPVPSGPDASANAARGWDTGAPAWEPPADQPTATPTAVIPTDVTPTERPETGSETASPAYRPQWDPARQAYLQWDPRREVWLQFNDDAQEWRPIS